MSSGDVNYIYCPKCKSITVCVGSDKRVSGLKKHGYIQWYGRHRKCMECKRKFLTAEIAEDFIFEGGLYFDPSEISDKESILYNENITFSRTISKLREENSILYNESITLNSAIRKLREENRRLDSEIKKLRDENRKLNEELDEDETPNLKLKRQYEELKKLYEKLNEKTKNNESSNDYPKPSSFSSENSKVTNANYIGGSSDQVFRERDGRIGNTPSYDNYSDESEP